MKSAAPPLAAEPCARDAAPAPRRRAASREMLPRGAARDRAADPWPAAGAGSSTKRKPVGRRARRGARASRRRSVRIAGSAARRGTRWRRAAAAPAAASPRRHATAAPLRAAPGLARRAAPGCARPDGARARAPNSGTTRAARSASRMSVPRPGPSSARMTGSGAPMRCHRSTHHRPMSSPNTWLTSGAVMKSPPRAEGIARRVIAPARIEQRRLHIAGDADRASGGDPCREMVFERRRGHGRAHAGAAFFHAYQTKKAPARSTGIDRSCPIVAPMKMKPRLASGWRKNSAMMRAMP